MKVKTETVKVVIFPGMVISLTCEDPYRLENFMGRTSKEQIKFEESISKPSSETTGLQTTPYRRRWQWLLSRMLSKACGENLAFNCLTQEEENTDLDI